RYPLPERDAARLLIYRNGTICEDRYHGIAQFLPLGSLLVFNDTRVIDARLLFKKPSGGVIELFCLDPAPEQTDLPGALQQKGSVRWQCLVGGASKWKAGQVLEKTGTDKEGNWLLQARYEGKGNGAFTIAFNWQPETLRFSEILQRAGAVPLPPYLRRAAETSDRNRYQTVYAAKEGSVAAPTAGLHFTEGVFSSLHDRQIDTCFLTLHVGAGTFRPVTTERMRDHDMHAEWIDVRAETIGRIRDRIGKAPVVAVGTTSLRTLETLYWMGVRILRNGPKTLTEEFGQWEAYELETRAVPGAEALQALMDCMEQQGLNRLIGRTRLLMAPGYRLRLAEGLVTNFHQPNSTLLLLVAAVIGEDWRSVYDHALANGFRFLSYGDGCLLWKTN
ncbi:MAG: hypothetical protein RJA57_784, partial [Bacteroidota bacterium]